LWLVVSAFVGLFLGYSKGIPRWGFLLGLFLGPIGCGIVVMLPNYRKVGPVGPNPFGSSRPSPASESGPYQEDRTGDGNGTSAVTCPRCRKPITISERVCSKCGNVLMPVRYQIYGPPEAKRDLDI
jgi:hypothetical protein